MKELLDKIGAYNIFNFLLPGVVFSVFLKHLTSYSIIQEDVVFGAFLYYFLGLAISRFGSLVIEPILKKVSFVQFSPYKDFVSASKNDPKLELLSQENNMYRTFIATFVLLGFVKLYDLISRKYPVLNDHEVIIAVVVLCVGFLLAYRKQTVYIKKRIDASKL
jgi:hypothetical protein